MKYTFECTRTSGPWRPNKSSPPHSRAIWSEEYQRWFISFENLADLMDFIKNDPELREKGTPHEVVITSAEHFTWIKDQKFDVLEIYDGYRE